MRRSSASAQPPNSNGGTERAFTVWPACVAVLVVVLGLWGAGRAVASSRGPALPLTSAELTADAVQARAALGYQPVAVIPDGWRVDVAPTLRRESAGDNVWTVNYVTRAGHHVSLAQAQHRTPILTHGGDPQGTVMMAGLPWQLVVRSERNLSAWLGNSTGHWVVIFVKDGTDADAQTMANAWANSAAGAGSTTQNSQEPL